MGLTETDAALTTGGTLTSNDVDNPENTFTPSSIVGTIGTFTIDATGVWTFTANSTFDSLSSGENINEIFSVTSVDGTVSSVKITINGTNETVFVSVTERDPIDPSPKDTPNPEEKDSTETEDPDKSNETESDVEPESTLSGEQPDEGINFAQTETTQLEIPFFEENSRSTNTNAEKAQSSLPLDQNTLQLEDNDLQVAEVTLADDSELWEQIDLMKQQMNEDQENTFDTEEVKMQFATGATTSLTPYIKPPALPVRCK